MKARNTRVKAESLNTAFGLVLLDHQGFVVNVAQLALANRCTPAEVHEVLCKAYAFCGFMNDDDFPIERTEDPDPHRYDSILGVVAGEAAVPQENQQPVTPTVKGDPKAGGGEGEQGGSKGEKVVDPNVRPDGLDQRIIDVVAEMLQDSTNLNTQAKLNLEKLNAVLKAKGLHGQMDRATCEKYTAAA